MNKEDKIILRNLATIEGFSQGLASAVIYDFDLVALVESLKKISHLAKEASEEYWKKLE